MKNHIKVYLSYFGYDISDGIICEASVLEPANCKGIAESVHHLSPRGMGGSKKKDFIENLCALCMPCHERAEHDKKFNDEVSLVHRKNCLKVNKPEDLERYL